MKPERIRIEDILSKKDLSRLARMLGHGLSKSDLEDLDHFRRTVDIFASQCQDPFVLGYLRALLEVAAAYQREMEKESFQFEEKLQGVKDVDP